MPFSEAEQQVISSHSGLIRSHTLARDEIGRAYRHQAVWVGVTIVFGLLMSSLLPASHSHEDCETQEAFVYAGFGNVDSDCTTRDQREHERRQAQGLQITLVAAVGVELAILCAFLTVMGAAHQQASALRRRLKQPSPKVERTLRSFLDPIALRIGVARLYSLLIDDQAHHWAPSVAEDKDGVLLVIPLGLMKLIVTDPKAAESILAHELGHVHEGDSWVFPTQAAHARMYRFLVAPSIVGLFIVSVLTSSPITVSRWALIGAIVSSRRAKRELQAARFATEERADAYGCIVSEGPEIARVLDVYVAPQSRAAKFHPDVTARKVSIAESLRQLERLRRPVAATLAPDVPAPAAFDLADLLNGPAARNRRR